MIRRKTFRNRIVFSNCGHRPWITTELIVVGISQICFVVITIHLSVQKAIRSTEITSLWLHPNDTTAVAKKHWCSPEKLTVLPWKLERLVQMIHVLSKNESLSKGTFKLFSGGDSLCTRWAGSPVINGVNVTSPKKWPYKSVTGVK